MTLRSKRSVLGSQQAEHQAATSLAASHLFYFQFFRPQAFRPSIYIVIPKSIPKNAGELAFSFYSISSSKAFSVVRDDRPEDVTHDGGLRLSGSTSSCFFLAETARRPKIASSRSWRRVSSVSVLSQLVQCRRHPSTRRHPRSPRWRRPQPPPPASRSSPGCGTGHRRRTG